MSIALVLTTGAFASANEPRSTAVSDERAGELMTQYCYDCHGYGGEEGGLALDSLFDDADRSTHVKGWEAVWRNLRSQMMPPPEMDQPSAAESVELLEWIERRAFQLDPANPDPGRVTIRRLNREEYKNTVRDWLDVRYDVDGNFPADDTGYGFDTVGDVLNISPIHMEKYLEAAGEIAERAILDHPPRWPAREADEKKLAVLDETGEPVSASDATVRLDARLGTVWRPEAKEDGRYRLSAALKLRRSMGGERFDGTIHVLLDEKTIRERAVSQQDAFVRFDFDVELNKGAESALALRFVPAEGDAIDFEENQHADYQIGEWRLTGPLDGEPTIDDAYRRVFAEGLPPKELDARRAYARRVVEKLLLTGFRRPAEEETVERYLSLFNVAAGENLEEFESGAALVLKAVLASPRFLFRAEYQAEPNNPGRVVPIDEFALASRLSYFLWSSLPDGELLRLAGEGRLRDELRPQIDRMIADEKFERFVENFVGQWLQTRDVPTVRIDARRVLRVRFEEANRIFHPGIRYAMKNETEYLFGYLIRENLPLTELLTANYSFLNETLANFYGIEGVKGRRTQKVDLPEDSPRRGGILAHGSIHIVTSNPTRTSPVKRGLFVLENLLGTPPPPAPPDVPELEEAAGGGKEARKLTMREQLELHRADPNCAGCHARMDPLGLAMEQFNAVGQFRAQDGDKPIETKGELLTGERFDNVAELANVIAEQRRTDLFRCVTEKMLTYALGRGVEYYDATTIDSIVAKLESAEGRMKALVYAIVESAPFQMRRGDGDRLASR